MPITWKEPGKIGFYAYFYAFNSLKTLIGDRPVIRVFTNKGRALRPQLIWKIAKLTGARITEEDGGEDISYALEDDTKLTGNLPWPVNAINGQCIDISKKRVEDVFYDIFKYELAVDPLTHDGKMVEKSNRNAMHDGHVVVGPLASVKENKVYERLIDNTTANGMVVDFRTCVVGNEMPFVYIKKRPVECRFSNYNSYISWLAAEQVFCAEERRLILRFAKMMHLDVGELDILRDREEGRIYIVDVAKTPHSPSNYYLTPGGIRCMHRAAAAFRRQYLCANRLWK